MDPTLLTLEVGARGLVGSRTFRNFVTLGFSVRSANQLCKSLSDIVSRCSYAIYLAHSTTVWSHNNGLVVCRSLVPKPEGETASRIVEHSSQKSEPNIVTLRENGIKKLYHFTDASNIPSIEQHGLMSASNLVESAISAKMNSDDLSRSLDASANLQNFVRLSFCSDNPMMYVAYHQGRISQPVRLEIKLEAVSRPGVRFTDCNATRVEARHSTNPSIVRFDVVKAKKVFDIAPDLRRFYQAEVLVPSPLPRHLIVIPSTSARMPSKKKLDAIVQDAAAVVKSAAIATDLNRAAAESGDSSVSEPTIAESAAVCAARRSSKSSSTSVSFSTTSTLSSAGNSLAEGEAATSSTSQVIVCSALEGSETRPVAKFNVSAASVATTSDASSAVVLPAQMRSPKSFVAPELPWSSTLVSKLQCERKERLFNLVDHQHVLQCVQFKYKAKKHIAFMLRKPRAEIPGVDYCEMPLTRSATCSDCVHLEFYNCPLHMKLCKGPVWLACAYCDRCLCWEHMNCYCVARILGRGASSEAPAATASRAVVSSSSASGKRTVSPAVVAPNATEHSVSTAREPTTVPAVDDAIPMCDGAVPSASDPTALGTARMKPVDVDVASLLSASKPDCSSTAQKLDLVAKLPQIRVAECKIPVLPESMSVNAADVMVALSASKRAPLAAQCAPATMSAEPESMPKSAADVEVSLSASKRVPLAARWAKPAADVMIPLSASKRVPLAARCELPVMPATMPQIAADVIALSASKRVPLAARCAMPVMSAERESISKIAAVKAARSASKRVPLAARCPKPVMSAEPESMPKTAADVKIPLSASTLAAQCATQTCRIDDSMPSAEVKTQVTSLCTASTVAQNDRSRYLDPNLEDNNSSSSITMRSCTNRKTENA